MTSAVLGMCHRSLWSCFDDIRSIRYVLQVTVELFLMTSAALGMCHNISSIRYVPQVTVELFLITSAALGMSAGHRGVVFDAISSIRYVPQVNVELFLRMLATVGMCCRSLSSLFETKHLGNFCEDFLGGGWGWGGTSLWHRRINVISMCVCIYLLMV